MSTIEIPSRIALVSGTIFFSRHFLTMSLARKVDAIIDIGATNFGSIKYDFHISSGGIWKGVAVAEPLSMVLFQFQNCYHIQYYLLLVGVGIVGVGVCGVAAMALHFYRLIMAL